MSHAHEIVKASKRRAPAPPIASSIVEARSGLLPGFKRFRRASRLQRASVKSARLEDSLLAAMTLLKLEHGQLIEWGKEENWVNGEAGLIWNGDRNQLAASQKVIKLFEKSIYGGNNEEGSDNSGPGSEPVGQ